MDLSVSKIIQADHSEPSHEVEPEPTLEAGPEPAPNGGQAN